MKVFLYCSSATDRQTDYINARLSEYAASNATFLVADSPQGDGSPRQLLAEMGYPSVTVYSAESTLGNSRCNWDMRRIEKGRFPRFPGWPNCFGCSREAVETLAIATMSMAIDADSGLVLWDGSDFGAFAAILCMVALDKPVEVIRADGTAISADSFENLHGMLPTRNPDHRPWAKSIRMQYQWAVAEKFIFSKSIASRLGMHPFSKLEIADVILGSPTSLDVKREAFEALSQYDDLLHEIVDETEEQLNSASGDATPEDKLSSIAIRWAFVEDGSFSIHRDAIGEALDALRSTDPGELIYRKSFWDERPELFEAHEAGIAPFPSIDAALEDLRFEMKRDEWDDDAPFWSSFEKWRLSPEGTWENPFTYYAIMDEIVFFDRNAYDEEEHCWTAEDKTYGGSIAPDLNIRVPFEVGDVITLDCRPFAPLRHALVIEAERKGRADCCMPRVLHLDDRESARRSEPVWTDAAPKHASGMHLCAPGYSPLYRMELFNAQLPEDEKLLGEVREWLQGDTEKGRWLSEAMMCEMTTDEIRDFMAADPA